MCSTEWPRLATDHPVQPIEDSLVEKAHCAKLAMLVGAILRGEKEVLLFRAGERAVHGPSVMKEVVMLRVANQRWALDLVYDSFQGVASVALEVVGGGVETAGPHTVR